MTIGWVLGCLVASIVRVDPEELSGDALSLINAGGVPIAPPASVPPGRGPSVARCRRG